MTSAASLALPGLAEDLQVRHARVRAGMRELGASCLVALRDQSVTYLTGYTTMTWKMQSRPIVAVLAADGRLLVLAADTEADSARLRIPRAEVHQYVALDPVEPDSGLPDGRIQFAPHAARVLGEMIESAGAERIAVDGLDAVWPPIGQLTRLVPIAHGRTVDASDLIWRERLRKTPWELERMRAASGVLERAYETIRGELRPGMTEREIATRFSVAQLEAGAHEVGPFAVVAGIDRGLFGFPTDRVWDRADLLYLDAASIVDGYWCDYCRTFAAREVRPAEREGYSRVRRAIDATVQGPVGATAGDLGLTLGAAIGIKPHEVGFGRFGHGIGLHVPEPPSLHSDDTTPLEPGFTLCIEPAVEHEGLNFVAEEEHVVTESGFERLTPRAPDEILLV